MAAELEKLRGDIVRLSRRFRDAGQSDLADLLAIDARGFSAKANIAKKRGFESLPPTAKKRSAEDSDVFSRYTPEQFASNPDRISPETKVYLGSLVRYDREGRIIPIFERLRGVERIYTRGYPHGRIVLPELIIGGMSPWQLWKQLDQRNVIVSPWVEEVMENQGFQTLTEPKTMKTVRLPVEAMYPDLRYPKISLGDIYQRADTLGLDLCFVEAGPHFRLKDDNQSINTRYYIAMKPIAARDGMPGIFCLEHSDSGLWLGSRRAYDDEAFDQKDEFVFAFRKDA